MPHIVKSTILNAPTDAVWNVLRDFNGHDRWHPAVATSTIERAQASDKIGCVRRFKLKDGSELREQLLALSDLEQTFSYCLLDTPIPMFNYVAHVRLLPVTDGDRTFWHWESRFTTRPEDAERLTEMVSEQIYQAGLRGHSPAPERGRMNAEERLMPVTVRHSQARRGGGSAVVRPRRALSRRRHAGHARAQRRRHLDLDHRARQRSGADADRCVGPARHHRRRRHLRENSGRTRSRLPARPRAFDRRSGGAQHGHRRRQSVRAHPYGDFTVALLALDATVSVQGGFGARDVPIEEFLQSRERQTGALVLSVSCQKPSSADAFRYRKIARIKPKGGSVITLAAHLPVSSGRVLGRADRIGLDGPDADSRQGRRARARRTAARRFRDQRRRFRRNRRHLARRQRARQRLVPSRDRRRSSPPPAVRSGIGSS